MKKSGVFLSLILSIGIFIPHHLEAKKSEILPTTRPTTFRSSKKHLSASQPPLSILSKKLKSKQMSLGKGPDAGAQLRKRVVEYRLPNGMLFLLVRRANVPTFSAYIRVKVGGVDEEIGYTGLAHILEHIAFKGTSVVGTKNWTKEQFYLKKLNQVGDLLSDELARNRGKTTPKIVALRRKLRELQKRHSRFVNKGEFSKIYEINGGTGLNATTGKDLTSYFVSLPSNRLALWAHQEAARLTAPVFREFFKERSVVIEEKRMGMSRGSERLYERFMATAFMAHPYRVPVVGWMSDITTIPSRKMIDFFKKYYAPSNMVGCIVGDIDIEKTKKLLAKTFGLIPKRAAPPIVRTQEPPQDGERRIVVRHHSYPQVLIGFHKPTAPHPDDDVFDMIEALLTYGPSSRLYKALVKKRLAKNVWASSLPGARFPNLFTISAKPLTPHTTKEIEKVIYAELERLKKQPVPQEELQKILNQSEINFLKTLRTNEGLASQLSYFQAIVGDWRYATRYAQRLAKVTPQAIMRVARRYFTSKNRTVATLVRTPQQASLPLRRRKTSKKIQPINLKLHLDKNFPVAAGKLPSALRLHPMKIKMPKLNFVPPKPTIITLKNGLQLYLLKNDELPLVSIYAIIKTGRIYDPPDKIGLAEMTGSLLRSGGFGGISGDKLDEILAFRAITLRSSIEAEYGFASLDLHKKELDWGLAQFKEMLQHPLFAPEKIRIKKAVMLEEYKRRNDNPFNLAFHAFRRLVYGPKSRWAQRPTPQTIRRITRRDLIAFHRRYYVPNNMKFVIVGDFDKAQLLLKIRKLFGSWKSQHHPFPKLKPLPQRTRPLIALIRRPLPQSLILVGHLGPRRHHPQFLAGKLMNYILGGASFGSRLITEIRIKRGLAYFAGSMLRDGRDKGMFVAYTGTSPQRTGKTLKLLLHLLKNIHAHPDISKTELLRTRKTFLNRFIFLFNSPAQIVYRRAFYDYLGYPPNYLQIYRQKLLQLSKKDLEKAAQTFIHPAQFVILVVGNDKLFDVPLGKFGNVLLLNPNQK